MLTQILMRPARRLASAGPRLRGLSSNKVTGYAVAAIFAEHHDDGLSRRTFIGERGVIFDYDIITIRRTGQARSCPAGGEVASGQPTKRLTQAGNRPDPIGLGNLAAKIATRRLPTLHILAFVNQLEPCIRSAFGSVRSRAGSHGRER